MMSGNADGLFRAGMRGLADGLLLIDGHILADGGRVAVDFAELECFGGDHGAQRVTLATLRIDTDLQVGTRILIPENFVLFGVYPALPLVGPVCADQVRSEYCSYG